MRFLNVKIQDIAGNTIAERDFEILKSGNLMSMSVYLIIHCIGDQKAIITETIIDPSNVSTEENNV